MIPQTSVDLRRDFVFKELPSKTYKLNIDSNNIIGFTDGLDAMRQAIFLMLNIERFEYLIYSWNYGIELKDLFGKPMPFVLSDLQRRITEALKQDTRILDVLDFDFSVDGRKVYVTFTVKTIFGDIDAEKVVDV